MTINKIPCAILSVFTAKNLWVEKEALTAKVHKSEVPFWINNNFYNFEFFGSVHHVSINENTNLMQQS